jgi:hypothetical protein
MSLLGSASKGSLGTLMNHYAKYLVIDSVGAILAKGRYGSQEYFGR